MERKGMSYLGKVVTMLVVAIICMIVLTGLGVALGSCGL